MPELEDVLVTRLKTFGELPTLVEQRIYPIEAPQNCVTPYITYVRIDEAVESGMTQDHGMTHPLMQIDCWALSYVDARAVGSEVRAALTRWADDATDPPILDSFRRRSGDVERDPDSPETRRLYRRSFDFEIWIRE